MASQVFYRKWRPQKLSDIVGQEHVTQTLLNALSSNQVSHAYLFSGPRGTGKTSTGRILAKAVNCLTTQGRAEPCNTCQLCQAIAEGRAFDVIEIDAASNRGIDEIRELKERVGYAPSQARYKVYIIDEVHMLTKEASNALLKTLEEPPPYVIFVLATTEAHKILPTILSRCQRFDFRRISQTDVITKLAQICAAEGIQTVPEALKLIARAATGSLRDAENLLQQLTTFYGSKIELRQVQATLGITGDSRAKELVRQIVADNASAGIALINNINNDGLDLRQFNREVVEYLRYLLLIKAGSPEMLDLTAEDKRELQEMAARASLSQILKAVKLFGQLDLSLDTYSTLPLELAFIDSTVAGTEKKQIPVPVEKQPARAEPVKPDKPPVLSPSAGKTEIAKPPVSPVKDATLIKTEVAKSPAAPVEEVAPVSPLKPAEPASEIEKLKLNWRQYIKEATDMSRTPAAALLRSARPKAIENNKVTLAFKYPLHKESMEKPDNNKIAEKIISRILGRSCQVQCVYEPEHNHLVEATLKIGAEIIDVEEK